MPLERGRELRQLRDGDALVADPLEVDRVWSTASTRRRSVATGACCASSSLDRPLDPVVALVDLVVERDHLVAELDVLRLERVDRAAHRAKDDLALLLEVCLERMRGSLELDACHRLPEPPGDVVLRPAGRTGS